MSINGHEDRGTGKSVADPTEKTADSPCGSTERAVRLWRGLHDDFLAFGQDVQVRDMKRAELPFDGRGMARLHMIDVHRQVGAVQLVDFLAEQRRSEVLARQSKLGHFIRQRRFYERGLQCGVSRGDVPQLLGGIGVPTI